MITTHSIANETRVLACCFTQETDVNPKTKKAGFRAHDVCAAKLRSILSFFHITSGIEKALMDGKTYYINRGSFKTWCKRHGITFKKGDSVSDKIQEVIQRNKPQPPNPPPPPAPKIPEPKPMEEEVTAQVLNIDQRLTALEPVPPTKEEEKSRPKAQETNKLDEELAKLEDEKARKAAEDRFAVVIRQAALENAKSEQRQKTQEKSQLILEKAAKVHIPNMVQRFYGPEGLVNDAELAYTDFNKYLWGMREEEYPQTIRDEALFEQDEGKADALRKKAEANQKKIDDCKNKFQKTLFPVDYNGKKEGLDFFVQRYKPEGKSGELDLKATFYYPNSGEVEAKKPLDLEIIRRNLLTPTLFNSGSAVYLHFEKTSFAISSLSKKARDNIPCLSCNVKSLAPNQIALYHPGVHSVLAQRFSIMASLYIDENFDTIIRELRVYDYPDLSQEIGAIKLLLAIPLANLFMREFYIKLGYRAVYCPECKELGRGYLALFFPDEDIENLSLDK